MMKHIKAQRSGAFVIDFIELVRRSGVSRYLQLVQQVKHALLNLHGTLTALGSPP
jgi:hypothetical protein